MSPVLVRNTFSRPLLDLGFTGGISSLPDLIEFDAHNNPDHIFGIQNRNDNPPCELTFHQLQTSVEYASFWLVKNGFTVGRLRRSDSVPPVGILLGSDITIFIYMAALLRIGTPVLLLSARLTPVALAHLLEETRPSCVLINAQTTWSSNEALSLLQSHSSRNPRLVDALGYQDLLHPPHDFDDAHIPPKYMEYERTDLDAVILHSSGTTGLPKVIYHSQTYPLLYASCHRLPEQQEPFCFNVSTLPLYHGFGLLAPSLSLSIGMPFILPPAGLIPTARWTLDIINSRAARSLFTVPSILEEFSRLPHDEGISVLKDLDIVAAGGAPMKESVGTELASAGVKLLNHWGCTELGAIAPIERPPRDYDWHYLMPRDDTGLNLIPLENGSYRVVGYPPGWAVPFEVQDLLQVNPFDRKQFKIVGRSDDLIVLSTGEKVRPTNLEQTISEHPLVKDVLAFGDGRVSLGLLIELRSKESADLDADHDETLMTSILPYLERGNAMTDKHGKVSPEMIVFSQARTKPFIRTDKGTLARKATIAAFDSEITACYAHIPSHLKSSPFPLPSDDCTGQHLRNALRALVRDIAEHDIADSVDFFEAGMDSLQASRLRQTILIRLRATPGLSAPVFDQIGQDFCFQNSSIDKICRALRWVMSGDIPEVSQAAREGDRVMEMREMVETHQKVLRSYASLATHARISRRSRKPSIFGPRNVVLLTGSTGSLGCFLLSRMANDPHITRIICFNRRGSEQPLRRQMDAMSKRGALIHGSGWKKVVLYDVDMGRPDFGLEIDEFEQLFQVTHIIHNAWPVNFNRSLSSFEPHILTFCHLIRLAVLASGRREARAPPTRILFTSTIAVGGRFPFLNAQGQLEIPEASLDACHTAEFGYPEAKWVCERLLEVAVHMYGNTRGVEEILIQGSNVRIGQMTGPEGSGAWNESEHFPIVIRTSQKIGALPAIDGSLSWIPVNRAADVICELLLSRVFKPFYHIENPSRQPWRRVLRDLSCILGETSGSPYPIISLDQWIQRVRSLGEDPSRNPAMKILGFLERDFEKIAGGTVILGMEFTKKDSPTLARSTALGSAHLREYVAYWRSLDAAALSS